MRRGKRSCQCPVYNPPPPPTHPLIPQTLYPSDSRSPVHLTLLYLSFLVFIFIFFFQCAARKNRELFILVSFFFVCVFFESVGSVSTHTRTHLQQSVMLLSMAALKPRNAEKEKVGGRWWWRCQKNVSRAKWKILITTDTKAGLFFW